MSGNLYRAVVALLLLAGFLCCCANRLGARPGDVAIGPLRIEGGGSESVAIGRDLVIEEGASRRSAVVIAGDAIINGQVERDLVVILGKVKLGPSAVVGDDFTVIGGAVERDPGATLGGEIQILRLDGAIGGLWLERAQEWVLGGLLLARPLPHGAGWAWSLAGGFVLLYLVMAVLLPRPVRACVTSLQTRPLSSFLAGLLTFLLLGPLIVLLLISVVGILALPFLACGAIVAFLFGKVTVYEYAGIQLAEQAGLKALKSPVVALLVGALLFCLLYAVPLVGFLAWSLAATFGFGAVMISVFRGFGSEQPTKVRVSSTVAGGAEELSGGEVPVGPPADSVELARAGFWIRFAATITDAILLVFLFLLLDMPKGIPIAWLVYHFGMWTWKGATIGGMIVGIKVLRKDGRLIDAAVALVRCLSAVFSAVVLFLGFFWAGWDRDKRSWHDIIAGTSVVRLPRH